MGRKRLSFGNEDGKITSIKITSPFTPPDGETLVVYHVEAFIGAIFEGDPDKFIGMTAVPWKAAGPLAIYLESNTVYVDGGDDHN